MGPLVSAEFAVAISDLSTFASPDHLAAYAGLAPMPSPSTQDTRLETPAEPTNSYSPINKQRCCDDWLNPPSTCRLPSPNL